jgi:hypothetical protein
MNTNRKRLAIVTGSTLALVLTGASVVSAQTPDMNGWGDGAGRGAQHAPGRGGMGDRGFGGGFGESDRGQAMLDEQRQLVRQELIVDLGTDGGIVTKRIEHGTVSAAADGSLTITLATGESVSVTTDADTKVQAIDLTERPFRTDAAIADVTVGSEVMVWSQSQEDGSFLASRVEILPAADATTTDDGTTTPEASPEASPAAVG